MEKPQDKPAALPPRKCPTCGKPVAGDAETYPFCGERCRTIDLAKWAREEYRITRPIEEKDMEDED
jgi:endogenous inhibitor of DNA gyrase (YacG/DUF329 family)